MQAKIHAQVNQENYVAAFDEVVLWVVRGIQRLLPYQGSCVRIVEFDKVNEGGTGSQCEEELLFYSSKNIGSIFQNKQIMTAWRSDQENFSCPIDSKK